MSIRINIENILKSPESTFYDIIKKITDKDITDSKKELALKESQIDTTLFDAITLILQDLDNEESYISRLLYKMFKFEIKKNIRREQLIILGSQLKSQRTNITKDIYRVNLYIANIASTLKNLQRLKKAFEDKNMFIFNLAILNKSNSYIDTISSKSSELEDLQCFLENRLDSLKENKEKYNTLFKKIPRYHELREETYLQLSK